MWNWSQVSKYNVSCVNISWIVVIAHFWNFFSTRNAKLCNKVNYCAQKHWKVFIDDSLECGICHDLVKFGREKYRSAPNIGTLNYLRDVSSDFCADIRFDGNQRICNSYLDELVPEIYKAMTLRVNPHVICSISSHCSEFVETSDQNSVLANNFEHNGDSNIIPECVSCRSLVERAKTRVRRNQSHVS